MSGNNHLAYADGHVLVNYIYYEITSACLSPSD